MDEKYTSPDHQLEEHYDDPAESAAERTAEVTVEAQVERPVEARMDNPAEQQQKLGEARQAVAENQTLNNPLEQLKAAEEPAEEPQNVAVSRQLESIALQRELKNLRRQLSVPQRLLSRWTHAPVIRLSSEAVAKSVSRPSGLLGGGLMAFVGSSVYLYIARHVGFRYNYLLFSLLFVGGFVVGLCLELLTWAVRRRKQV